MLSHTTSGLAVLDQGNKDAAMEQYHLLESLDKEFAQQLLQRIK
jgi:hypothetical protein